MAGVRRKARIIALQALFEVDSVGHSPEPILERLISDSDLLEESAFFARELVRDVLGKLFYEKTRRRPMILPIIMEV